jgi:hypothetical protein
MDGYTIPPIVVKIRFSLNIWSFFIVIISSGLGLELQHPVIELRLSR